MGLSKRAAVALLAAGLVLSGRVSAQESPPPDPSKADETFHAGHQLLKDGKLAAACPKFEESQRADPASGTLLALAYCQELSGLLASACGNYRAAADLAAKEGQAERQKAAAERAEALAKRVSTLTLQVPAELSRQPGLQIRRDGVTLERTAYNVAIPLNGGTHAIEVTAPGYERWAGVVTLQSEADHKTLALPTLEKQASAFVAVTAPRRAAYQPTSAASRADANTVRVMRQASLALGIGSAVGVGLGVTFGIAAKSRNDASNRDGHCDATGCDVYGSERRSAALDAAMVSTWSFVAAGAFGAGALVLYFSAESKSAHLATSVVDGSPRVLLRGSF